MLHRASSPSCLSSSISYLRMDFVVLDAHGIPFGRAAGPGGYDTTLGRQFPSGPDGPRPSPATHEGGTQRAAVLRVCGPAGAARTGRETGFNGPFCPEPGPKARRGLMP